MSRPTKITINEALKEELSKLVTAWRPNFGNQEDIRIRDILGEIIDKTNGAKLINGLRSTAIYLLKNKK
jgi:hypothetical protein